MRLIIGAFGDVRLCLHISTGHQRAVKLLFKDNMNEEDKLTLMNEINILSSLDHPSIIKMYEYF